MTLRFAWRSLLRVPGFAALVVVTFALGIGATTAMFSVVDAVLLRPLRFAGAERAVEVWTRSAEGANAQPGLTGVAFSSVRDGLADVAAVEGYQFGSGTITGGAEPIIAAIPSVSPGLLQLVGASPLLGSLFTGDDAIAGSPSVLISERTWTSQFGRARDVVGRRIAIDGRPHTIIGVLPNRMRYPEASAAIWKPLDRVSALSRRRVQALVVRRPEVSIAQLRAQLAAVTVRLREQGALTGGQTLQFDDAVQVRVSRDRGRSLWLMLGAVGLVLLVGCANVMNLLLVRASYRRHELAVLSAIGAERLTLLRHTAVELLMLIGLGTVLGIALAVALLRAVPAIVPEQLSYLTSTPAELNWRVLGFAIGIASLVAVVSGLLPVLRATRVDAIEAIQSHTRTVIGSRDERWQAALLAVQIGTVVVLVVGTGLLLRSFERLTRVNPGYDASTIVSVSLQLTADRYQQPSVGLRAMQDLERRVEAAGVGQATLVGASPIPFNLHPEGEGGVPVDAAGMELPGIPVSPDHFRRDGHSRAAGSHVRPARRAGCDPHQRPARDTLLG